MTELENTVVICMRVEGTPLTTVVRDATEGACVDCSAPIWVAPSTWALLVRKPDAISLCVQCAIKRIAAVGSEPITFGGITPEQMAEIARGTKGGDDT